jgi:hypothetical protein
LSFRAVSRGTNGQFFLLKYLLHLITDGKKLEDIIKEQAILSRKGNIYITETEEMVIFEFFAHLNNLSRVIKEEENADNRRRIKS